ncbi:MAG: hypothetical protein RIQ72_137 [Candidatus Parcubacteria bacterium]
MQNDKTKITQQETDFSKWYLDVIECAELAENSPVRGSMVIKPYGYAIWENIQKFLDLEFKKIGIQNAYFPLLIPKSFLEKEAQHVEGFAKECAVVTHHRLEEVDGKLIPAGELEEPLIIRPTSETIIYDTFSRWIKSYRDLPLLINQWANVMRWEMRTRLFLRSSEFLWQEGHTAHELALEAENMALNALNLYKRFLEEELAISAVPGKKTENEKFAGADYTLTLEALMQDGKALQCCTSHMLGQNFSKSFNVSFLDKNQTQQYVWQTSWGLSTRIIGALIMSHSDNKGLVLPPRIAPIQVVLIPIYDNKDDAVKILDKIKNIAEDLALNNIRYKIDDREGRPGFKFFEWERRGVPLRIELGPKDLMKQTVVLVDRLEGNKVFISDTNITEVVTDELQKIQLKLLEKTSSYRLANTHEVDNYDELKTVLQSKPGFVSVYLCKDLNCEKSIKEETGATTRCIPFSETGGDGECIFCKNKTSIKLLLAKAY